MRRRDFLRNSTLAGAGLLLGFRGGIPRVLAADASGEAAPWLGDFLRISPTGEVSFLLVKHEMGQGLATALPQILCEELGADWSRVRVEFPPADMARWENDHNGGHGTGGSCTITYAYDLLRKAGATARHLLIAAAATQWGVPARSLVAQNHFVLDAASGRRLGFGELATRAATMPVPVEVKLKSDEQQSLIGHSATNKLAAQMVTGEMRYGIDTRIPGMSYAVIARCPVFKGRLRRFDASRALAIPGVRQVFSTKPIAGHYESSGMVHDIREGVAVVADNFWAAHKGREALDIEWDEGDRARQSSADFEKLAGERARLRQDPTGYVGDENAVMNVSRVRRTLRAAYVFPHQAHSCMEPLNCTAFVNRDECEIWCGSQVPNLIVDELVKLLGLPADRIRVQLMPSGGGFGRRAYPDNAVEAAFISREAGHVPVKMLWTREDDQTVNLVHHFQHMEYQAAIDEKGRLFAWYEKEIRTYSWGALYAGPELPAMAYDIPNIRYDFEDLAEQELIHSSAWRGVVNHGRWMSECFVDEIAAALERDPLEFRLSLLTRGREVRVSESSILSADRFRRVLELAAGKAEWGRKRPRGTGLGICLAPYGQTIVACIAEVTVSEGALKLERITVAVDCGRLVNPLGATKQIEGGIVWGLTSLLYGGMPIRNGRALHRNFADNKLLRMPECPPIDVFFTGGDAERPWGIGEVSAPAAAPAVLNAIAAITGVRIRRVPIEGEIARLRIKD